MSKNKYTNPDSATVEEIREVYLEPEEAHLLDYLDKFNRSVEKSWQKERVGIFAR